MNVSFHLSSAKIAETVKSSVMKRTKAQVGIKMPKLNEHIVEVSYETEKEEISKNIHNLMSFANVTHENIDKIISEMGENEQQTSCFNADATVLRLSQTRGELF